MGPQAPNAQFPDASQYPYPYTGGFQAIARPSSAARPGIMNLALVLLILGVLPVIALGGLALTVLIVADAPQSADAGGRLATQFGTTPEQGLMIARIAAGVVAGLGLIFLLAAVQAWLGRNWGRVVVTVFTALLAAVVVLGLTGGGTVQDTVTLAIVIAIVALLVVGVVLLYLPGPAEYYRARAGR
jgi:hypothetical protein